MAARHGGPAPLGGAGLRPGVERGRALGRAARRGEKPWRATVRWRAADAPSAAAGPRPPSSVHGQRPCSAARSAPRRRAARPLLAAAAVSAPTRGTATPAPLQCSAGSRPPASRCAAAAAARAPRSSGHCSCAHPPPPAHGFISHNPLAAPTQEPPPEGAVDVVRYRAGYDQARTEEDLTQLFRCAGGLLAAAGDCKLSPAAAAGRLPAVVWRCVRACACRSEKVGRPCKRHKGQQLTLILAQQG